MTTTRGSRTPSSSTGRAGPLGQPARDGDAGADPDRPSGVGLGQQTVRITYRMPLGALRLTT
jgi:hypothetical protein